ncbi:MAG: alpha/beta hydrolase [Pseudobdellovibrionaceae bacterium]|jgi:acetyl esterase/lipase|nr:alpha/beta hydrolase [Pseudobdellovibrionaceae bacterium]
MTFRSLLIIAFGFSIFLSSPVVHNARAADGEFRQKLIERFIERRQEKTEEAGEAGNMLEGLSSGLGDRSCSKRLAKAQKLQGKSSKGPKADIVDIAYGNKELEKLDIFLPDSVKTADKSKLVPIIVMVHGGGWCVGDKTMKFVTEYKVNRWVPKGFMFISVNYPMITDGFDAYEQTREVAKAMAYIQKNAAAWGGDANHIVLMGHSAGAHLVSMFAANAALREEFGAKSVSSVISLDSGATNVITQMQNPPRIMVDVYNEAFGTDKGHQIAASPFHQISAKSLPWLGVCSTTRPDDSCGQAKEMADKLDLLGIMADTLPVNKSHGGINSDLGKPEEYTEIIEEFMAVTDPVFARYLGL